MSSRNEHRTEKTGKSKPDKETIAYVQALFNQALAHHQAQRWADAEKLYRQILAIDPQHADSLHLTGLLAFQVGRYEIAIELIRRAIAIDNDVALYHNHLGCAYRQMNRMDEAMSSFRSAIALQPDFIEAFNNMASALKIQGNLDEAVYYYKKALTLKDNEAVYYSNLLMAAIYAASVSPAEVATVARAFGEKIADPLIRNRPFTNERNAERKLRIGYVSPDFREHAVSYFMETLIKLHNREKFEVFAYSSATNEDNVTARLKQSFDHWRPIRFLNDDQAADLIEQDKIDILVDLAGHTGDNRLEIFARKPAPIQVTWLGFPATTGMKAMDYRITDVHAEPEGMTEHLNVEKLWRLPTVFACYQAPDRDIPVIDHPPFEDNGYITFGCFNNFAKVTDPVLETWARVMAQVPDSRLLLEITGLDSPKFRKKTEQRLKRLGLPMERVMLEPRRRENQFVLYNKLDIALDPFPCNGGTTSFDCMWMGVPFVALAGEHFVSRMGVTILTNAGLPELIAKDRDEYVKIATVLAQDKDRLRRLRHGLRDRVVRSPLMDQPAFARHIEHAYRGMWRKWCAEQK